MYSFFRVEVFRKLSPILKCEVSCCVNLHDFASRQMAASPCMSDSLSDPANLIFTMIYHIIYIVGLSNVCRPSSLVNNLILQGLKCAACSFHQTDYLASYEFIRMHSVWICTNSGWCGQCLPTWAHTLIVHDTVTDHMVNAGGRGGIW